MHRLASAWRDTSETCFDRGCRAVRPHPSNPCLCLYPSRNERDKIPLAFFQRYRIATQDLSVPQLLPMDCSLSITIHNPPDRFITDFLLETNSLHRPMDPYHHELCFLRSGTAPPWGIPRAWLRRGWVALTRWTRIAFGTKTNRGSPA
jgi:hypothetical protein